MKQFLIDLFKYLLYLAWYKLKIIAARYYTVYRITCGAQYVFIEAKKVMDAEGNLYQKSSTTTTIYEPKFIYAILSMTSSTVAEQIRKQNEETESAAA